MYQAVVYANWVDQKLKEDVCKIEKSSHDVISLESDIAHSPNEEITIVDDDPKNRAISPKNLSAGTSNKSASPKTSPGASPKKVERGRAVTDINKLEERKKGQDLKNNQNSNVSDEELKLDDTVNFQSFEILKMLGSGAFGKVYKVTFPSKSSI